MPSRGMFNYHEMKALNKYRKILNERRPLTPREFVDGLDEKVLDWQKMREKFLERLHNSYIP